MKSASATRVPTGPITRLGSDIGLRAWAMTLRTASVDAANERHHAAHAPHAAALVTPAAMATGTPAPASVAAARSSPVAVFS